MDFLVKSCAELKKKLAFENPRLEDYFVVQTSNLCNFEIYALLSLKMIPLVALDLLFPNLQVSSNSDMPRGIGDNFPQCIAFWTIQDIKLVMNATCHCFNFGF